MKKITNTPPSLPLPTLERLSALYSVLESAATSGVARLSSRELGRLLGYPAHLVRKDISLLLKYGNSHEGPGEGHRGYAVEGLLALLSRALGLTSKRRACIVGLGRLGTALLHYSEESFPEYEVVAGFDSNTNRLELISTRIPLYPAFRIPEVVMREEIEVGILAVPPEAVETTVERLKAGGIRGLINFTSRPLPPSEGVWVRTISLRAEMRVLSALLTAGNPSQKGDIT
ncbi:Redox-sensing transcriptional repressor rex [Spirochaeta thermophila DSM 6578]|uniref:Redox-sensing transcriptional repressor Rex n=1 Tax=Winmispira thermophila (strain ATCC 700085 / DSM 6578 / Z-1203) TaxID=869211 RepID=G0GC62_WINT7|nr:redox-sensing transcriptional repressor Rex [Spirochaeta thermophila]AEJ60426.1 Redox-sensing transcriptional repressor rex [Spirochaeta thermophila DSM 6578]